MAVVRPLLFSDLTLAVLLLLLPNPALPPESRVRLRGAGSALTSLGGWIKAEWRTPWVKGVLAVVIVVLAVGGYAVWNYLLRAEPDYQGATP